MASTAGTATTTSTGLFPPGSRVRARDEEWVVEKCLPVPTGGYAVHLQGLTELVRHHKAILLTELDTIEALRPEDTKLVPDASPEHRQTRLFLETLLRRTPPTDPYVHVGHRAAITAYPYQLVPARKALENLRARILMADGVGLGKTIEVGVLLSELIKRGRGRRILVVAIKSMLGQLQQELWARFTIPLVRLDSEGIQRVQAKIPSNRNPFSHYDRAIISVDTLKNNARYRAWLEQTRWDVVVVDECHNVANRGSQREALARLLADKCDTLILTSATPHNGRPESFANLMRMLDRTAVADERSFTRDDVAHLFVRRFKKDIEAEAGESFSDRQIHRHEAKASPAEEAALRALRDLRVHTLGRKRHGPDQLFRWVLVKAFLSSPHACLESIDARIARIHQTLGDETEGPHSYASTLARDAERLRAIRALVEPCAAEGAFTKLAHLISAFERLGFDGTARSPRVIVFSERIETLRTLGRALCARFHMDPEAAADARRVAVFEASLGDIEQKDLVESFGKKDSPLRLLLASDAASEGVNLHYYCNQLFHFDVPWSLIRLEQRMGRIDRFGQEQTPHLHYMLAVTEDRAADQQIIDRLIDKEEEVHKHLGEAGVVLGIYDAEVEEDHITRRVAEGVPAEEVIPDEPVGHSDEAPDDGDAEEDDGGGEGIDLLALFAETDGAAPSETLQEATRTRPSLYASDFELAKTGLEAVEDHPATGEDRLTWDHDDDEQSLRIWAPESFRKWREPFLPAEAVPADNEAYRLVADRDTVSEQIRAAREHEGEWPAWHLLWEQHPVLEWLLDALAAAYARNEAPVVRAPRLGAKRAVFLFQVILSNQRSQPVLAEWFGVQARWAPNVAWESTLTLEEALDAAGFRAGLSNTGDALGDLAAVEALVPDAVARAREHAGARYEQALGPRRKQVREATRRLERWRTRSLEVLAAKEARYRSRSHDVLPLQEKRLAEQRARIERSASDHDLWIQGLTRHGDPHVRLCGVFVGEG